MGASELTELCRQPAIEIRRRLWAREVSIVEMTEAHLRVIERMNPRINAIVTLVAERALADAREADTMLSRRLPHGPLHGLVVAHKDLTETAGIRTTFGSPLFSNFVPDRDSLIVERLKGAGAITIGKTNTPEWGAGSNTTNPVFGPTRNPYNTKLTSGGSSGGAAAALASGMVALADGSDMGGSLRNPAAYCNVVGLRPAPGRVPDWPNMLPWQTLAVNGPMGRTVQDVALMLSVLAGPDDRCPNSLAEPGDRFDTPLLRDFAGVKVAWSRTLGGLPVQPEITDALGQQREVLLDLGCKVADIEPDFAGADIAFLTWRAWSFEAHLGPLQEAHPDQVGPNVTWNIMQGRSLSGRDLARAEIVRAELYHRMRVFMNEYEFLVAPVTQVVPFPPGVDYPRRIGDVAMTTYIDWMKSCWMISATGHPAISVPGGFTGAGLPVGLQIVGRHRDELGVLQIALAVEQATEHWRRSPPID